MESEKPAYITELEKEIMTLTGAEADEVQTFVDYIKRFRQLESATQDMIIWAMKQPEEVMLSISREVGGDEIKTSNDLSAIYTAHGWPGQGVVSNG